MQIYWEADGGGGGPSDEGEAEKRVEAEGEGKKKKDSSPGPVPYSRFKEVNDEKIEFAAQVKAFEEKEEERKAEQAKELGKCEELYAEEKTKRAAAELSLLRHKVAMDKGLPGPFVDRLEGDDREALEKDADAIWETIKDVKPHQFPGRV